MLPGNGKFDENMLNKFDYAFWQNLRYEEKSYIYTHISDFIKIIPQTVDSWSIKQKFFSCGPFPLGRESERVKRTTKFGNIYTIPTRFSVCSFYRSERRTVALCFTTGALL